MPETNIPRVLITDDVDTNRFVLKKIIDEMGYMPVLTENGEQALKVMEKMPISLILLDVAMPVMDGYECCRMIKDNPDTRDIPVIFISAFDDPGDVIRGFGIGGSDYITKPFIPEEVKARVSVQMRLVQSALENQEMNRKLRVSVLEQQQQLEQEKQNILYALSRVARENAAYDAAHMERVSANCKVLAEAMQLTTEFEGIITDNFVETVGKAAPLCDLGNVAIPTDILQKVEPLTEVERRLIQSHTTVGAKILDDIVESSEYNDFLTMAAEIARYHHENWDGTGYPAGIRGEEIPIAAQVVAVASSYCSLTEQRVYRECYSREEALSKMEANSGIQYNPSIFEVLKKIARQLV